MEPINQARRTKRSSTSPIERVAQSPVPAKHIWGQLSPGQQQLVFRTLVSIGHIVINEMSQHQTETKNDKN